MKKVPSILKYVIAIAFTLTLSIAFSIAYGLTYGVNLLSVIFPTFCIVFAVQMILGRAMQNYFPKGAFRNDSLVVTDTTYAGTFAPYFILPALFEMDTYNKGVVYFKDGIKKQHTIGKIDFSNPLQPNMATHTTSGGNVNITGNVINPQNVDVYQEFNPRDLELHWTAEDLSTTLLTRQLPPTIENYISLLIVGRAFEQIENCIWMGSQSYTAVPGSTGNGQLVWFNGFLQRFVNDAAVYKTAGAVALTTGALVNAAFLDLYTTTAANNKALLTKSNRYKRMKFLVSVNTSLLWEDFQAAQPFKNINVTESGVYKYKGFEIQVLAGMPDNTIVFTEAIAATDGNLWLGSNSILDENFMLARILPLSEIFGFMMKMKWDVNYGFANKTFVYTTLTAGTFTA